MTEIPAWRELSVPLPQEREFVCHPKHPTLVSLLAAGQPGHSRQKAPVLSSLYSPKDACGDVIPIIGRLVSVSKLHHWARPAIPHACPYSFEFTVMDASRTVTCVAWNSLAAVLHMSFRSLAPGTLLLLRNYTIKRHRHTQAREVSLNSEGPSALIHVLPDVGIATVEDAANRWPLPAANFTSVRHLLGVTNGSTCDLVGIVLRVGRPYRQAATGNKPFTPAADRYRASASAQQAASADAAYTADNAVQAAILPSDGPATAVHPDCHRGPLFRYRWVVLWDGSCNMHVHIKLYENSRASRFAHLTAGQPLILTQLQLISWAPCASPTHPPPRALFLVSSERTAVVPARHIQACWGTHPEVESLMNLYTELQLQAALDRPDGAAPQQWPPLSVSKRRVRRQAMSLQTPAADAIHLPITQPLLSRPRSLQEWQQLLLKSGGAAPRWTDEAAPRQQVPTIQRSGPHLRLLRLQELPRITLSLHVGEARRVTVIANLTGITLQRRAPNHTAAQRPGATEAKATAAAKQQRQPAKPKAVPASLRKLLAAAGEDAAVSADLLDRHLGSSGPTRVTRSLARTSKRLQASPSKAVRRRQASAKQGQLGASSVATPAVAGATPALGSLAGGTQSRTRSGRVIRQEPAAALQSPPRPKRRKRKRPGKQDNKDTVTPSASDKAAVAPAQALSDDEADSSSDADSDSDSDVAGDDEGVGEGGAVGGDWLLDHATLVGLSEEATASLELWGRGTEAVAVNPGRHRRRRAYVCLTDTEQATGSVTAAEGTTVHGAASPLWLPVAQSAGTMCHPLHTNPEHLKMLEAGGFHQSMVKLFSAFPPQLWGQGKDDLLEWAADSGVVACNVFLCRTASAAVVVRLESVFSSNER